jgi:DNA-binding response OmpR family regulator
LLTGHPAFAEGRRTITTRLQSLVLCADEKILRVLRRVLSDLEIAVDHCAEADAAIHKLTRQRYEAVIVDCADERVASQVLRSARSAPCNKRAVAVAIIDADKAVRGAFELGAHFVLYKPISAERAKTSFRAARALMKRERRRNTRIPVEIPVVLQYPGTNPQRTVTSDIGEGGIAVRPAPTANATQMVVQLTLPGSNCKIECTGEVAWANSSRQAGIRFSDLTPETTSQLKSWLDSHAPELDKDDPPVPATLTDLSPGGGYLQTGAPFPVRTRVVLSLGGAGVSSAAAQVRAEGIVRVAHPEVGMGVEFIQRTPAQREQLGRLIEALVSAQGATPEILVEPEGLDPDELSSRPDASTVETDPLLGLFRSKAQLPTETFLIELRQQRGSHAPSGSAVTT